MKAIVVSEFGGAEQLHLAEAADPVPDQGQDIAVHAAGVNPVDAGNRADDYLTTLRAVLDHDRSWQLAAGALHIHKQTLGYRIRKIEQPTGRGITRTEHLAEWWFALRAHDLLHGGQPRQDQA